MKLTPNMFHIVEEFETIPTSVELRRIDPSLNMRRFYRMSLQPDLFGGVDVVREWGWLGWRGKFLIQRHSCEDEAVSSMLALETAKRRRGCRSAG